jgi:GNAT superfamily N-acetyltransferase
MLPRYDSPGATGSCWLKPVTWYRVGSHHTFEITSIKVHPFDQRRGVGSRLLSYVCAVADKQECVLLLTVSAMPTGWMNDSALMAWYARHGFEPRNGWQMVRLPIVSGQQTYFTDTHDNSLRGDPFLPGKKFL